jgi:hypothetical protein
MNPIIDLANVIYGESASENYDTMLMVGSSAINRLNSNKLLEFGATLPEILQKGYYSVSNPNIPYKQAQEQKFPDKESENKYKQALAIASGLIKGTIEPTKGQFYFTDKEINKFKRNPRKFNLKAVKQVGEVGNYKVFSY